MVGDAPDASGQLVPASNWAGNVTFGAVRRERPADLPALQRLVARSRRLRALGTGHSFSRVADTDGVLVSLAGLPRTLQIRADRRLVTIGGQWTYGELARVLHRSGLALSNTGSLPHISVAGACATGTHGSGVENQPLGAAVREITLVTASGDLVRRGRGHPDYDGCVLALGRLGVVVEMALEVVPTFQVAQTVLEGVPDAQVAAHLETILSAAYSVSIFTTWGPDARNQVWLKDVVGDGATQDVEESRDVWEGRLATEPRHPVPGMPPASTTQQLAVPGPWHERLPHFRPDFMPSAGDELQSEYLVPTTHATAAWCALDSIRDVVHPMLHVSELRAVAADPMWLSLTGGHPCVAFHFTWKPGPAVADGVAAVEAQLAPHDARPHWGKVFSTTSQQLDRLYPRLSDFRRLVHDVDPDATFAQDLVDGWLGLA